MLQPDFLQNENLLLRSLEPEDLDFLYRIENDTIMWSLSNTLTPYSKFILKQYIENSHRDIFEARQQRFIITVQKTMKQIGAIDLFDFDPYNKRAGVGIVVERSEHGKGYALQALELLKRYCFVYLKLHQLYCNISESNDRSLSLFEKCGFEKVALKKEWNNTIYGWENEYMLQCINNNSPNYI